MAEYTATDKKLHLSKCTYVQSLIKKDQSTRCT